MSQNKKYIDKVPQIPFLNFRIFQLSRLIRRPKLPLLFPPSANSPGRSQASKYSRQGRNKRYCRDSRVCQNFTYNQNRQAGQYAKRHQEALPHGRMGIRRTALNNSIQLPDINLRDLPRYKKLAEPVCRSPLRSSIPPCALPMMIRKPIIASSEKIGTGQGQRQHPFRPIIFSQYPSDTRPSSISRPQVNSFSTFKLNERSALPAKLILKLTKRPRSPPQIELFRHQNTLRATWTQTLTSPSLKSLIPDSNHQHSSPPFPALRTRGKPFMIFLRNPVLEVRDVVQAEA